MPKAEDPAVITRRQSYLINFRNKAHFVLNPSRAVRNAIGLQLGMVAHCAKTTMILGSKAQ